MGPQEQPVPQAPQPTPTPQPTPQFQAAPPQFQPAPVQVGVPSGSGPIPVAPKSKKGLIVGLVSGITAVVLIIVGVILFVTMSGVSKDDYYKASHVAKDMSRAYSGMGSFYLSTSSSSSEIQTEVDNLKSSRSKFESALKELGETKAVKNDGDINKLYKALTDKKQAFDRGIDAALEAYEKIVPAIADATSSSAGGATVLGEVKNKLEGISDLKDNDNKKMVQDVIAKLGELQTLYAKVAAGRADIKQYSSQAVTDYYAATSAYSKIVRDWQTALRDKMEAGELKDQINNLSQALVDKANK